MDIWKSNDDGLALIEKLLESYLPQYDKVDFWIESSCLEIMPTLILLYFESISRNKHAKVYDKDYQRLLRKIDAYFRKKDDFIEDVNSLKEFMYDMRLHREILSIKL